MSAWTRLPELPATDGRYWVVGVHPIGGERHLLPVKFKHGEFQMNEPHNITHWTAYIAGDPVPTMPADAVPDERDMLISGLATFIRLMIKRLPEGDIIRIGARNYLGNNGLLRSPIKLSDGDY